MRDATPTPKELPLQRKRKDAGGGCHDAAWLHAHVLHCTEVSQQSDVVGHQMPRHLAAGAAARPPIADSKAINGGAASLLAVTTCIALPPVAVCGMAGKQMQGDFTAEIC
jgi:hypothetical protein